MAGNPMQKKVRNSFILGMLIMLIIALIVGIMLFFVVRNNNSKEQKQGETITQTYVYCLNTDVKSQEIVTIDKLTSVLVDETVVPAGAYASKRKQTVNGEEKWVTESFPNGEENNEEDNKDQKDETIYRSKLNLAKGTIITDSMLYTGKPVADDERIQEYNMLQLPVQLTAGEFVDVRLTLSDGQDYLVVSDKEVIDVTETTISLQLSEAETLLMNSAIVEAYMSPAYKLYVTKYVEPGNQKAAAVTYVPSSAVIANIQTNPNVVEEARNELTGLYDDVINGISYQDFYRGWINNELNRYEPEERLENVETKMQESRELALTERIEFLNKLEE